MCFAEEFAPTDIEDTFDRRLTQAVEAVTRFAVSFAWLSSKVPGSRRVLPPSGLGERATWVEAARSSRCWSPEELAALASSDIGLGRVEDADKLTLMVSTAGGIYERVFPNATPLRGHERQGLAAEVAVQDAAATWGLPDFVMVPSVERKGRGVREISDGLLVVGDRGVVVQIKAREGEPGTREKESSWVLKQLAAAAKQIHGTVRRLKTHSVQMTTGRGRSVHIDSPSVDWVGVTIIEHPAPPSDVPVTPQPGVTPVIALLRRDWEFLFDQLRSTHAVVAYLHRIGGSAPVLGNEPERYYELAAADAAAAPGPVDPTWKRRGGQPYSVPLLPAAPAGSDDNEAHAMVRIMLEDVATSLTGPDEWEPWQVVLASLDSLPVGYRTNLGRFLLDALSAVTTAEAGTTAWRMRTFIVGPEQDQLGFAICSALTDHTRAAFSAWLQLRHHERGEMRTSPLSHHWECSSLPGWTATASGIPPCRSSAATRSSPRLTCGCIRTCGMRITEALVAAPKLERSPGGASLPGKVRSGSRQPCRSRDHRVREACSPGARAVLAIARALRVGVRSVQRGRTGVGRGRPANPCAALGEKHLLPGQPRAGRYGYRARVM